MSEQEKRNQRTGLLTSLAVHATLFLALFFLVAWRAPNPPLPDYGIELNFGLDAEGSGDIQPDSPVGEPESDGQTEAKTEPENQPEETQEQETTPEQAVEVKTTEVPDNQKESPVSLKEEKKTTEKKEEVKKPEETKKQQETAVAEYKKPEKKEGDDKPKEGTTGSQGDRAGKTGDQGSPEGKVDAKALYGTPGGGGGGNGMNLTMAGWAWADEPKVPDLPDNETGKVEFEIECDENGEITGIKTSLRTLSLRAEQLLKDEIMNNSLVHIGKGIAPPRSKGKIVFVVKSN